MPTELEKTERWTGYTSQDYPFIRDLEDGADLEGSFREFRDAFHRGDLTVQINSVLSQNTERYDVDFTIKSLGEEDGQAQFAVTTFCRLNTTPKRKGLTDNDLDRLARLVQPVSDSPSSLEGLAQTIVEEAKGNYKAQTGLQTVVDRDANMFLTPTTVDMSLNKMMGAVVNTLAVDQIVFDPVVRAMVVQLGREKMEAILSRQQHRNDMNHLAHLARLSGKAMTVITEIMGSQVNWRDLYLAKFADRGIDFKPTVEDIVTFFNEVLEPVVKAVLPLTRRIGEDVDHEIEEVMTQRQHSASMTDERRKAELAAAKVGVEASRAVATVNKDAQVAAAYRDHERELVEAARAGGNVASAYVALPVYIAGTVVKEGVQIPIRAAEGIEEAFENSDFSDGKKFLYSTGLVISVIGFASGNIVVGIAGLVAVPAVRVGGEAALRGVKNAWQRIRNRGGSSSGPRPGRIGM